MMRYKLVIAEKPSVAQSLAAVIGATARKDGYLEGNGWRVSWCVGHLAGLADADSYDPKYAKWRYDDLPILPEHWQMVVGKDKKKQFDILKKLMNAPDVTEVVNACDAGREGELIFRSVYELAGCQKPMKRLWISSMEDSAIREGFANLRPGVDYDGLRKAALCRAKADWLVGINATRLFSVLYHRTLNIGRVMSPTLALIVQREAEIDTFKPVPFYTVALELPGLTVSGERISDRASAEQLKEACQDAAVTIKKVECKEKSEKPPALYDLTTLQRDANRLLGFTAQQTLDYLQSLYEKKLCTYPRTDSRYLTGDMADSLPVLVNLVANAMPFRKGIAITCDPQTVINDKKVTDHHAVIPTRNLKDADLSALPAGEKAVLELVALRLLCAVAQPHIYSETVVIAACAGGEFTTKEKTVRHPGWKALEDAYRAKTKDAEPKKEGAEKAVPELTEGQTLSVSAAIVKEGKSSPPQHFTEDTLLSAMETAGKEDMPEDAERKGLGTPATRAGILEKLVSAGFLERKKSRKTVQLLPSHDAVSLITVLLGTVLGCLIALLRLSRFRLCSGFAKLYITVIRGTPLLVQLYIVYYQLHFIPWPEGSILGVELARVMPCILALSMNSTAYVAEVIRSGIQAVDFGQTEAALSCGMTRTQAMVNIILPQAVKNILPALCNEFISTVKGTSLASVFFVGELMTSFKTVQSATFLALQSLTIVGIIYFLLNFILSRLLRVIERRLTVSD